MKPELISDLAQAEAEGQAAAKRQASVDAKACMRDRENFKRIALKHPTLLMYVCVALPLPNSPHLVPFHASVHTS